MIQAYNFEDGHIKELKPNELKDHLSNLIWIDLFNPTVEEETLVEAIVGVDIPTRAEIQKIELSSRLYQQHNTLFATINVLTLDRTHPESHPVTFVLHDKWLITVRYVEGSFYNGFIENAKLNQTSFQGESSIVSDLFEEITEHLGGILDNTTHRIKEIHHQIFKYHYASNGDSKVRNPDFKNIISSIGLNEDILSKTQESLFTITRMLNFILETSYFRIKDDNKKIGISLGDISSLIEHATFLSNKLAFLLDATLGMINIEQSSIIKIVSVAAVVFLPPTLVASIYGMNFQHMPEIHWQFGYPIALLLMVLAGFLPYKYFKFKGWL